MCSVKASQIIAEQTKLFKITVSFGSVSSSISLPCYMSHASIPAEVRAARGLPDHLVRISVGMEHPQDLLDGQCCSTLLCNWLSHSRWLPFVQFVTVYVGQLFNRQKSSANVDGL